MWCGDLLLTGSYSGDLQVWDMDRGQVVVKKSLHSGKYYWCNILSEWYWLLSLVYKGLDGVYKIKNNEQKKIGLLENGTKNREQRKMALNIWNIKMETSKDLWKMQMVYFERFIRIISCTIQGTKLWSCQNSFL